MRVGVVSVNLSFFGPLARAFAQAGDKLVHFQADGATGEAARAFARGCDATFGEFCQHPIEWFLGRDLPPLYVRTHRIEMYQAVSRLDWSACRSMWFSAEHVQRRFLERCAAPPQRCEVSPTNLVASRLVGRTREACEPYRMLMVGRWVPKKRTYTAVQLMAERLRSGRWELWLLGSQAGMAGYGNAEYAENVMDLVNDLGVRRSVRLLGHLDGDRYDDALRACDAVLSLSNEEGTHVGVAEAMSAGCVPFVHGWRGASAIYPGTFLTFEEFYAALGAWEALGQEQKLGQAHGAAAFACGRGDPQEEAKRIVDSIHADVVHLRAGTY